MNKQLYIESMHNNLHILFTMGAIQDERYKCPLCMQSFSDDEVVKNLTEEDVPQASLGGKRIALTCRSCNSTCGHSIDVNLLNAIIGLEQRKFFPLTDRKINLIHEGQRLGANLHIDANRQLFLEIDTKRNNPKIWDEYREKILKENALIDLQIVPLKRDERLISAALLKNAYLLLFARTGYTFLADSYYDDLRMQINNPKPYILPERLWTLQNVSVADGIFLCRDNRLRGFFVVYTLSKVMQYRVCVFIPSPNVPYLTAAYHLRNILAHDRIRVEIIPSYFDFLNNRNNIARLRKWCYGWDKF